MNAEPINVVYTYTRDEYLRAIRRHYKSKLSVWRDLILAGVLILIGAAALYFTYEANFGWLLIVLGLILILIVVYGLVILPVLIYRADPKLKWEYSLSFYEDRIEFKTNAIDSTLQWPLYHSWVRDDEFCILYHGKRNLTVIPRRSLASDNSDERLAKLLQRKIGAPLKV